MALGAIDEGVFAQAIDGQLDLAELDLELAAFAAWQYGRAEVIANFEFKALFVINHQSGLRIDLGHVKAFGGLLGDIDKTRLKLLDQLSAQIAQYEKGVHIQITYCQ
jgi:hypothetical protein